MKFAFFKDGRGMTRVQAIGVKGEAFANRVSLSAAWRGLRADEIKKINPDLHDAEFVHHAGFIGGAWTMPTCLKMAELSIIEHEEAEKKKAESETKVENAESK
jgi:uncharacterized UPF0160 family protein